MKRMIDNKDYEALKNDVKDVEGHTSDYVITSVVVEDEEILGTQVKDVENDITYNLPLGSQVEANPTLVGTESDLESIGIDGTNYKVGGGKQLYQHNISISENTTYNNYQLFCTIISDRNTAYDWNSLETYLQTQCPGSYGIVLSGKAYFQNDNITYKIAIRIYYSTTYNAIRIEYLTSDWGTEYKDRSGNISDNVVAL